VNHVVYCPHRIVLLSNADDKRDNYLPILKQAGLVGEAVSNFLITRELGSCG